MKNTIDQVYGKGNFTIENFNELLEERIRFQPTKNKIYEASEVKKYEFPQDSSVQIYSDTTHNIDTEDLIIYADNYEQLIIELDKEINKVDGYIFVHGGKNNYIKYIYNIYIIVFNFGKKKI